MPGITRGDSSGPHVRCWFFRARRVGLSCIEGEARVRWYQYLYIKPMEAVTSRTLLVVP